MKLYHGTSQTHAQAILRDGVNPSVCDKGYFGRGFYCADTYELAWSNYAALDDDGVVLELDIPDGIVLSGVSEDPRASIIANSACRDDYPAFPMSLGVQALSDNSFGGVVIYDASIISSVRLHCPSAV